MDGENVTGLLTTGRTGNRDASHAKTRFNNTTQVRTLGIVISTLFFFVDEGRLINLGAITLLAYFHYCNKGVFPFTETAREQDIRNLANLDSDAMGVVRHTRHYAIDNSECLFSLLFSPVLHGRSDQSVRRDANKYVRSEMAGNPGCKRLRR